MDPANVSVARKSRRLLWVIIGVAVLLLLVAAAVAVALGGSRESSDTSTTNQQEAAVATSDEVKQNLSELDASIKQSTTDRESVKASLEDDKKQIKVGN